MKQNKFTFESEKLKRILRFTIRLSFDSLLFNSIIINNNTFRR